MIKEQYIIELTYTQDIDYLFAKAGDKVYVRGSVHFTSDIDLADTYALEDAIEDARHWNTCKEFNVRICKVYITITRKIGEEIKF